MRSALTRRVTRLECAQPAQHYLLAVTKVPIAEWPEEVLADFLEAIGQEGSWTKSLLGALSVSNLEALIEVLGAEEEDS